MLVAVGVSVGVLVGVFVGVAVAVAVSVGVLVAVGRGELDSRAASALLEGRSELPAKLTAPASGLFLERVFYKGDDRTVPLKPATPVP